MTVNLFTVFLVDDDAGVLKALDRALQLRGYQVRSFTSPQAFLTSHDASVPGCAILDVAMPIHSRSTHNNGVSGSASTSCVFPLTVRFAIA